MKEEGQGMKVVEKTRWEGDKTVGVEGERNKFGKTRKGTRLKR